MMIELIIAIFVAILTIAFYFPMNYMKDLNDVGYYQSKKSAINRARRTRKLGSKIPPPFPNGWYAIAESREVKSGCAISVDCLGENFAVFRSNDSGKVFVLDAYCPHMGANLGVGGMVSGDCVECPFHAWKFSGDTGECVNIPYSKDGLAGLAETSKVKKWTSQEISGLIMVWYHREDDQPWRIPAVKEIENNKYVLHGKIEFFVNTHIQDILENTADVHHFNSVHGPSALAGSDIRKIFNSFAQLNPHVWNVKWSAEADDDRQHTSAIQIHHFLRLPCIGIDILKMELSGMIFGPGYSKFYIKSFFGQIMLCFISTPVEPFIQKVTQYYYAPRYLALWCKMAVLGGSITLARDIAIWNNKTYKSNPVLTKEDKSIKLFRQWYSQFYSKNSVSFASAATTDNKDKKFDW